MPSTHTIDQIDARILLALIRAPRATALALAEETGLSRNTVQARLSKLESAGALESFERRVNPSALGYPLQAFVLTNVTQRKLAAVSAALAEIPEILEVHGLSGVADLLVHVVARDADDLYRVAGRILDIKGVKRTSTALVMRELLDYRIRPLVAAQANRRPSTAGQRRTNAD
ncbi:Lrp/AsnC family transcriptional regulator [Nocardia pseudovaccinii]|uniref:Lrp/AsnC family transcriptional regulator n=1 Tax=Nocardia pseudovaccinii TaxID=189540 RepID=UPI0007A49152|nr:Lrp/AsnC family transcriptional regulator [Nocardia pseudovaccinii]